MKISKKAVRAGFEWENYKQLLDCFYSEIKEFQEAQTFVDKEDEDIDVNLDENGKSKSS